MGILLNEHRSGGVRAAAVVTAAGAERERRGKYLNARHSSLSTLSPFVPFMAL